MKFEPAPDFNDIVNVASVDGLKDVAAEIVTVARRTVNSDTGAYARFLRVRVDDRGVVAETTDYAGHIIEWGGNGQSPQSPIRTGATSAGKFDPA